MGTQDPVGEMWRTLLDAQVVQIERKVTEGQPFNNESGNAPKSLKGDHGKIGNLAATLQDEIILECLYLFVPKTPETQRGKISQKSLYHNVILLSHGS